MDYKLYLSHEVFNWLPINYGPSEEVSRGGSQLMLQQFKPCHDGSNHATNRISRLVEHMRLSALQTLINYWINSLDLMLLHHATHIRTYHRLRVNCICDRWLFRRRPFVSISIVLRPACRSYLSEIHHDLRFNQYSCLNMCWSAKLTQQADYDYRSQHIAKRGAASHSLWRVIGAALYKKFNRFPNYRR